MSTLDAPVPVAAPFPTASWFVGLWRKARLLYQFLLPVRFSFLALGIVAFAFIVSDQGHDIIARLVEDDPVANADSANPYQRAFFVPLVFFLALQIWYWSRQLFRIRFEHTPSAAEFPTLAKFLPRLLGASAFMILLAALYRVGRLYGTTPPASWHLAIGLVIGLILFIGFTVGRRKYLERKGDHDLTDQRDSASHLAPATKWVLRGSLLVAVLFFLAATFFVQQTGVFGSVSIVLLSMSLWVSFGSLIVYWAMRANIPILTWLLILALVVSPYADNHVVKGVPDSGAGITTRPTVSKAFGDWYQRLHAQYPGEGVHPVFVVATEGGGIRAAYWTATVLTALADDIPHFNDHLFAVSGVSGGSFGAAVYGSLLMKQQENPASLPKLRPAAREMLAHDALAPTLAAMIQPDFVQRFVPAPIFPDRARALEGGWEAGWRKCLGGDNRFATGFLAMMNGRQATVPSLFLNGTVVETGNRIIASNLQITNGQGGEFSDALDLFDAIGTDVPVSTAVDNSTRFTYFGPAGTLLRNPAGNLTHSHVDCKPGQRCEHVIDGGYFENSGAVTAAEIVNIIRRSNFAANVKPVVLVIHYGAEHPKGADSYSFANEVFSPVRGLLNTRDGRGVLAVDQLTPLTNAPVIPFKLVQHPDTVPLPLGWLLSFHTRSMMDAQMGRQSKENGAAMQAVAALVNQDVLADAVQDKALATDPVAKGAAK
jgi:hypothetical protein